MRQAVAFWVSCRGLMVDTAGPERTEVPEREHGKKVVRDDKCLDENLARYFGEEGINPPHVVKKISTGPTAATV